MLGHSRVIKVMKERPHRGFHNLQDLSLTYRIIWQLTSPCSQLEQVGEVRLDRMRKSATDGVVLPFTLDLLLELFGEVLGNDVGAFDDRHWDAGEVSDVSSEGR